MKKKLKFMTICLMMVITVGGCDDPNLIAMYSEGYGSAQETESSEESGSSQETDSSEASGSAQGTDSSEGSGSSQETDSNEGSGSAQKAESSETSGNAQETESSETSGSSHKTDSSGASGSTQETDISEGSGNSQETDSSEASGSAQETDSSEASGSAQGTESSKASASSQPAPVAHSHTWDGGSVTTAATCGADGVKTYTCTCGETKTESIPATGAHQMNDITEFTPRTCTSGGWTTVGCTMCDYGYGYAPDPYGHDIVDNEVSHGNCSAMTVITHICSRCGLEEPTSYIQEVNDHDWVSGTEEIFNYDTHQIETVTIEYCSRCGTIK